MEAVAELDVSYPRTLGRARRELDIEFLRDLTGADLALLASERGTQAPQVQRLRDRHHSLARCLAQGMSNNEASAVTGYDPSRISILLASPDFKNLVAHYRKVEDSLLGDFVDRATTLTLTAMNELQERLEDKPESLGEGLLLEVAKSFADRTGHAPVQRNVNINANVNLGDRLSAARKRVAQAPHTPTLVLTEAACCPSRENSDSAQSETNHSVGPAPAPPLVRSFNGRVP